MRKLPSSFSYAKCQLTSTFFQFVLFFRWQFVIFYFKFMNVTHRFSSLIKFFIFSRMRNPLQLLIVFIFQRKNKQNQSIILSHVLTSNIGPYGGITIVPWFPRDSAYIGKSLMIFTLS